MDPWCYNFTPRLKCWWHSIGLLYQPSIPKPDIDRKLLSLPKHITPALIKLHWLPVKQRVLYKQALITFNVLRHNNPSYFSDLLTIHNPSRNLWSSSHHLLSAGVVWLYHPPYTLYLSWQPLHCFYWLLLP